MKRHVSRAIGYRIGLSGNNGRGGQAPCNVAPDIVPGRRHERKLCLGAEPDHAAFTFRPGSGGRPFFVAKLKNIVSIQPIRIEVEREQDGRILAAVPELPGVMAYGTNEEEAIRKVKAIALQVLADMIDSGEEVPESLRMLFAA